MNCKKAKQIDLISYLIKQGFKFQKITSKEVWFYSPFRNEKTSSFKVDRQKNVFYDFGEGVGGTIIDFVMKYKNCSVKKALEILSKDSFSFHQPSKINFEKKSKCSLDKTCILENKFLIEYIESRKLNLKIVKQYCSQVHYTLPNKKQYYGIGFKNNMGGFEIRNKHFKGCLNRKAITTIFNNSDTVCIFESFTDFLAYKTLQKKDIEEDYIITNSTALVKNCIALLKKYKTVKTYFDNDISGQNASKIIMQNCKIVFIDCSYSYKGYKDLNDYLIKTSL